MSRLVVTWCSKTFETSIAEPSRRYFHNIQCKLTSRTCFCAALQRYVACTKQTSAAPARKSQLFTKYTSLAPAQKLCCSSKIIHLHFCNPSKKVASAKVVRQTHFCSRRLAKSRGSLFRDMLRDVNLRNPRLSFSKVVHAVHFRPTSVLLSARCRQIHMVHQSIFLLPKHHYTKLSRSKQNP